MRLTRSLPPLRPMLSHEETQEVLGQYFGYEALFASIESGAIRPIKGHFIEYNLNTLKCHEYGRTLPCRQQIEKLHPDAYWTVPELRAHFERLLEEYELHEARRRFGRIFVAVSYRWLARACPDIDQFQMKKLGAMIRTYRQARGADSLYSAAFKPLSIRKPEDIDCAVFLE